MGAARLQGSLYADQPRKAVHHRHLIKQADAAMLRHGPVPAARGVLAAVGEPAFPQAGPDLGRLGGLAELGDAGAYD